MCIRMEVQYSYGRARTLTHTESDIHERIIPREREGVQTGRESANKTENCREKESFFVNKSELITVNLRLN